jgi:hypothetical protein
MYFLLNTIQSIFVMGDCIFYNAEVSIISNASEASFGQGFDRWSHSKV